MAVEAFSTRSAGTFSGHEHAPTSQIEFFDRVIE
jgi:hypothetical protein